MMLIYKIFDWHGELLWLKILDTYYVDPKYIDLFFRILRDVQ